MKIVIKDGRAYDFNPLGQHNNFAVETYSAKLSGQDQVVGYYVNCETGGNMNRGYVKVWKPSDVKVI